MPIAKISSKGQVTIPAEIRKFLGVTPGTHLRFVIRGNTVQIEKGGQGIAALKGSVLVAGEQDFLAVRQHAMGEVASEIAGEGKDVYRNIFSWRVGNIKGKEPAPPWFAVIIITQTTA
ncbi:AbrB-like domain [Moorella glycerini]|uniref:SpoVT-AbrB domain-containing protein n=1 Tax=Neomoorella stamsii TaxID=1266720 RepID=A0A9X7P6L9_9FIRM|nr:MULTISPECIES: AbrB/MazE/SpoVT family DNA-binding domain-containing protein [Moorella]PRR74012.1 hypothetical protein MOST_11530 [Moorella stamsii]CEP67424.1 AbrB-like domain [Moorella glycerini]